MQITFNETEVTSAMERYVRMRLRLKPEDVCVFEFTATRGVVGGVRAVVDITEAEDFVPEEPVKAPVSAPEPQAPAPSAPVPRVDTPVAPVEAAKPEPEKASNAAVQLFAGLN